MQILSGIILLGVLIVFHELGHFLFAKLLKVRVLVFSLGFGPKLLSFTVRGTEYRLSAIPLGGYIRMFGESLEEELSPEEKKMSFMHQAIWRKSLIAVAGPVFNFILPVLLFFGLLVGHEEVFAPKVGTILEDGPAQKAGVLPGDLVTDIDGRAIGSFNQLAEIVSEHPGAKLNLGIERKDIRGEKTHLTIAITPEAKAEPNPLEKDKVVGRIGIMPAKERALVFVGQGTPLLRAGLENGDDIITINGLAIDSAPELFAKLHHAKPHDVLRVKRKLPDGEVTEFDLAIPESWQTITTGTLRWNLPANKRDDVAKSDAILQKTAAAVSLKLAGLKDVGGLQSALGGITIVDRSSLASSMGIKAGDKIVTVDGEPFVGSQQLQQLVLASPHDLHVLGVVKGDLNGEIIGFYVPQVAVDKINLDASLRTIFGIELASVFTGGDVITKNVSVGEALRRALVQTYDLAALTAKSLWLLVRGEVPASQIGGPIMLFDVAQQAATKGLSYYIFIMCLLSVNLGLLNLLPIPALDGGHLLLFGIEAVQRKPLTQKTRAIATQIGISILLLIMAMAIFNDIRRLFG